MTELMILIDQGQSAFTPGSLLQGTIRWQLDVPPRELKLRLIWFTSGKGTTDIQVIDGRDFSSSQRAGTESFQFTLPENPYSFSGKLISLHWALELVAHPGDLSQRTEFTLSPKGTEIVLSEIPQIGAKASFNLFKQS